MRERDVEKRLGLRVRDLGGMAFKFISPGNAGVPDRIVILPGGEVWFIELKSLTGVLRPIQEWQIGKLKSIGANVAVIKGMAEVEEWYLERMSIRREQ